MTFKFKVPAKLEKEG